ncbi:MAG: SpoIIE family protein phosphatase [Actinomycetota bacterium]|nr:SpoIIE family protein phosphatase [Actinomycetota bacterium]
MSSADLDPGETAPGETGAGETGGAVFSELLEDSIEDLYENAPCGYLSTRLDGRIAKINGTLLSWLGYSAGQLVGLRSFSDLLNVGGRLYYETHLAPLLLMQGEVGGVALELRTADGRQLPVLVTSVVKTDSGGKPKLIRTTVFDARDRRAYERELLRARQEGERERERLQDLVATLQQSLLPTVLPAVPGLDAVAHYHAASPDELGGDFYDLFPLTGNRWGLFLGDVCGKGARAAALTSLIRYTLRTAAVYDADPATVLRTLNEALHQQYLRDDRSFCTVIFGVLAPAADGFTLALTRGGHSAPLLMRADGTARYLPMPVGPLIGAWADVAFTVTTISLFPGDTLLLFTDGLTEARVPTADLSGRYGDETFRAFAADLAPSTAAAAVAAIGTLLAGFGEGSQDDTAVLALGVRDATGLPHLR